MTTIAAFAQDGHDDENAWQVPEQRVQSLAETQAVLANMVRPVSTSTGGAGGRIFGSIPAAGIIDTQVDWLIPEVIPVGMLTALIGEEGIGKGLFACHLIAQVTTGSSPHNVLLISGEDDWSAMLRPRLKAAGADLDRVHLFTLQGSPGMPHIPEELEKLRSLVHTSRTKFVVIDPWLSVVSPRKKIRDTQDARQVFDELALFVKEEGLACLLVGHTNRNESASTRNRYGASIAIRQVARICLMALPDPAGPDTVIIGVDKSNISSLGPATRYLKASFDGAWHVSVHPDQYGLTISQHVADAELRDRRGDRRHTEHREVVDRLLAEQGWVSRRQVMDIYLASGSSQDAADKALSRWTTGTDAFLTSLGQGRYGPLDLHIPPVPPALQTDRGL